MSKYSLSLASLVAAIPAGFLAYVLVMAFLQKPGFNEMAGFFQIISGLTLGLVSLAVLLPVGILIFGKKPEKTEKPEKKADDEAAAEEEEDDLVAEEEASLEDDDFADDDFGDGDFADDDFEDFDDEDDEFK